MPNTMLPDSKLEIINLATEENRFILKNLGVATLTEKDTKFLVEYLFSPFSYYSSIDLSQCHKDILQQVIQIVLTRKDSEEGFLNSLMKLNLQFISFPGSQFLEPWAAVLERDSFSRPSEEILKKIFEALLTQFKKTFQKDLCNIFTKLLTKECLKLMQRLSTLHENPTSVLEHITYAAIILYKRCSALDKKIKPEEYKLIEKFLFHCFSFSDNELRYSALRLLHRELLRDKNISSLFLKTDNKRFFLPALALRTFSEKSEIIKELSKKDFYRQGIYNRLISETLVRLAWDEILSSQSKLLLITNILDKIKVSDDKNVHYSTWALLLTLIQSKVSNELELYLSRERESKIKDESVRTELEGITKTSIFHQENLLEDLFWKLFSHTLKLPDEHRASYQKHFNQPLHHLFFGYRQNMIQQGLDGEWGIEEREKFDQFLVAVIKEGPSVFSKIRYDESNNPHLATAFSAENGKQLKKAWVEPIDSIYIKDETFLKNCTLHCSDDYYDIFTWALGINCLEPLWGKLYMVAHLLNGQHKVVLLKDLAGQVIGGYLSHLLLTNPHNPKPILAIGKSYIRDGFDLKQKREIQVTLDRMSKQIAEKMGLPLVAILTNISDQEMHRTLEKAKEPQGIFITTSFVGGEYDTGLDFDWFESENRKTVAGYKRVIFDYQCLFTPSITLSIPSEVTGTVEKGVYNPYEVLEKEQRGSLAAPKKEVDSKAHHTIEPMQQETAVAPIIFSKIISSGSPVVVRSEVPINVINTTSCQTT